MEEPLFQFWRTASLLKQQPRMGWKQKLSPKFRESVAEHSFGVAVLAIFEAERRHIDVCRLLKLAIVHDLEESITGDLTPRDKKSKAPGSLAREREAAVESIIGRLPPASQSAYRRLWGELKSGNSKEARLLKQLDKLEMAFQAKAFQEKGARKRNLVGFYRTAGRMVTDPVLSEELRRVRSRG